MTLRFLALATASAGLLAPAGAQAATLTTDLPCYVEAQPMTITGAGWPAADWSVSAAQLFDSGTTDVAGGFVSTAARAPIVTARTTRPKAFTLVGKAGAAIVAKRRFRVVNLLVKPARASGSPTGTTRWRFSGFAPGKAIYFHVRRAGKVWTRKAGKGSRPCGTLSTRMRRLPAVPAGQVRKGTYRVFVDNRRTLTKGRRQFTGRITVS